MNKNVQLSALLFSAVGVILILLGMFFVPAIFILSLNMLVPSLAIAFTWKTWLASYTILFILGITVKVLKLSSLFTV